VDAIAEATPYWRSRTPFAAAMNIVVKTVPSATLTAIRPGINAT
jgi:hypothetical protein